MSKSFGHPCSSNFLNSRRCFVWLTLAGCWQGIRLEVYCSFCAAASAPLAWPLSVSLARDFSCTPGISVCVSGWIYIAVYVSGCLCWCVWLESLFISFLEDGEMSLGCPFPQSAIRDPVIASDPPSQNSSFTVGSSATRTEIIIFLSLLTRAFQRLLSVPWFFFSFGHSNTFVCSANIASVWKDVSFNLKKEKKQDPHQEQKVFQAVLLQHFISHTHIVFQLVVCWWEERW